VRAVSVAGEPFVLNGAVARRQVRDRYEDVVPYDVVATG
jgi:hypothetical protein